MKTCKKCKREFKDDYIYCPQCGKPYDDSIKPIKTPGDIGGGISSTLFKIWNIILYIFGGFMILGSILTIVDNPVTSIVGILFGLSLLQIIYKIIEEKAMIDEKYLKIARVLLPIVLIILFGVVAPTDTKDTPKESTQNTTKQADNQSSNQSNVNSDMVNIKNIKSQIESMGITLEQGDVYYKMVGAEDGLKLYSGDYRIEIYKFDKTSEKYKKAEAEQKLSSAITSFSAVIKSGYAYLIDDGFPKHDEVVALLEKLQ